jgi:hypothetical protein
LDRSPARWPRGARGRRRCVDAGVHRVSARSTGAVPALRRRATKPSGTLWSTRTGLFPVRRIRRPWASPQRHSYQSGLSASTIHPPKPPRATPPPFAYIISSYELERSGRSVSSSSRSVTAPRLTASRTPSVEVHYEARAAGNTSTRCICSLQTSLDRLGQPSKISIIRSVECGVVLRHFVNQMGADALIQEFASTLV